ncbi:hypothetical protein LINPERPRIM_LOCUS25385 [Linum perenne]
MRIFFPICDDRHYSLLLLTDVTNSMNSWTANILEIWRSNGAQ